MSNYQQRIAIVKAIREVVPEFSHYQEVSKRIIPFIEKKLATIKKIGVLDRITDYMVFLDIKKRGQGNSYYLKVWGNGILLSDAVDLFWNDQDFPAWQQGLLHALDVADMSDYRERELAEQSLIGALQLLEDAIKDARHMARIFVETLPIPTSATVRKDSTWDQPSYKLRKKFPLLF